MIWWRVHRVDEIAELMISGEIATFEDQSTLPALADELAGVTDVRVTIDSTGGNTAAALELYHLIVGRCSIATVTGLCLSAAVPILLAADRRRIVPDGRVMIHGPADAVFGGSAWLRQRADGLDRLTGRLVDTIDTVTNFDRSTVAAWMAEDTWFDADEAFAAGLVHEIVEIPPPQPAPTEVATPTPGPDEIPSTDDGSERLALDLLQALPPIRTADPDRFIRNVLAVMASKIK